MNWAMGTIGLSLVLAILGVSITNVSLPILAAEFQISNSDIVWISVGYQTVVVMSLIPLAALGEIIGYQRIYITGLMVFTLGSALCGLATSFPLLVGARALQGLGAAGIMSVQSAIVRQLVPEAKLGRAIGFMALVVAITHMSAPLIGSAILHLGNWHWLFFLNIPLGAAAMLTAAATLPKSAQSKHRFDPVSAALCMLMLGFMIISLDQIGKAANWTHSLTFLGCALGAGIGLMLRQRNAPVPLFPTDLLRLPQFTLPLSASVTMYSAQGLAFVALPFLFFEDFGLSVVETGLMLSPWPMAILFIAPLAGLLSDRYTAPILSSIGSAIGALGIGLTVFLATYQNQLVTVICLCICGVGFALYQPSNSRAIILGAPVERSGSASGIEATARNLGQTLGGALVGICFHLFHENGAHYALMLAAGTALAAALINATKACIVKG